MPRPQNGIVDKSGSGNPVIYIYDEIGPSYWGLIGADTIVAALREIGVVPEIDVRLNTPGGDVFEASAIFNHLRENSAKINIKIDGLAASAGSVIAMVGDKIMIAQNAMIMIHEAWTIAMGPKSEMLRTADLLGKVDGQLIQTYVDRTGNSADEVQNWVEAETWFTAQEAIDNGFADEITHTVKDAVIKVPKGRFKNTPAGVEQFEPQGRSITLAKPPARPQREQGGQGGQASNERRGYSPGAIAARARALRATLLR